MLFWQHWHGEGFGSKLRKYWLLHVYANGKLVDRMHALGEEIFSGIIEPHAVLLKTLVLVNSKCDLLAETERAFLELRKKGFPPDITTLNAMLSIYGRRQMVSKTNEILNFMNESGYSPSLTNYNSLMYIYAADSMFEEAIDVQFVIKHGCKPNQNTYNSIVDGYCKLNRRDVFPRTKN
ncbi:hypothetical protein F3Y22_tig00003041pilonHSYRG01497 [Hibiscus syriacus]|uniref:Pentatricopeptide repeat-containing protein n=1 Tax=Hibiscus syriacus TaxID=106335 RepID=A0A6A3CSE0_HIBSY|nr:hypothetical protein F3Y22_tig00003041pilonHSYRG01497 [Hibiscus syriacus]